MRRFSAIALLLTVVVSVCSMWVQARWPTTLPETAAFGLSVIWVAAALAGRVRLRLSFGMIPLAALLLWAGFQMATGATVYAWRTKVAILYWAANLAFFFVGLQVFADGRLRMWMLRGLVVFAFVMAVIAPLQALDPTTKVLFLFDLPRIWWTPYGPFPSTNQYAAFIELLLPVALYGALTDRKLRTFWVLAVAVMYASVITSASRAGFALTTVELLVVPPIVLQRHRISPRVLKTAGLLFAGLFIMLALAAGPANLLEKFKIPDPYAGRREFVASSIEMIKDKPLVGVGLGNWSTAYPAYAIFDDGRFANQAHNDWAQWTVEGGLPLLGIMLILAVWAIPGALRSGWGAGVAAVFAHCVVDYPIQRTAVAIVFSVVLAAVASTGGPADDFED
jgi:O-antigen ligase